MPKSKLGKGWEGGGWGGMGSGAEAGKQIALRRFIGNEVNSRLKKAMPSDMLAVVVWHGFIQGLPGTDSMDAPGGGPMDIEQIEAEIMKLEPEARAELARRILENLDAPSEAEALRLWVGEAERRLADLRRGNAAESPADEVLRRVRDRIA
jgi:hypothetical protein